MFKCFMRSFMVVFTFDHLDTIIVSCRVERKLLDLQLQEVTKAYCMNTCIKDILYFFVFIFIFIFVPLPSCL